LKKAATIFALTIIFLALCSTPPIKAQEQTDVIINADGTVSPSTAPIQQEGNIYRLTGYFQGGIEILRNNIMFNGEGNTISCSNYEEYGIKLSSVINVTITNVIIRGSATGCSYGIALTDSINCSVTNNTVTDVDSYYFMNGIPYVGICISGGEQNTVSQNRLLNNLDGMYIADTSENSIAGNSIDCKHSFSTGPKAISLYYATNNRIYHNTFILTAIVTSALGSNNSWDNGFPSGGNYWSNYQSHNSNPRKINNTGLLDVAYVIDEENIDNYPLAEPYSATTPVISILSTGRNYNMSSFPLNFTVDQPAVWMGYSLDGTQNRTLSGNQTLTDLANGQHTVTIYANDSFGNTGSSLYVFTVAVPLSPVFIVGIIVIAVVAAVIVGVVYYRYTKH
jgi:parallel beta-helix repeat protein